MVIAERAAFPRGKTCGGVLTPRTVHELHQMGLADALAGAHRLRGVRACGFGREQTIDFPSHPVLPSHGHVVRRRTFDEIVARNAANAGATLLEQHEAIEPIVERGFVRGAMVRSPEGMRSIRASYLVLADGANSRFGRAIGTFRRPDLPYAIGARGYWHTPRHAEPWMELDLGLEDRNGTPLPAYGWVFPLGDGTANVGVGVLSTARDFKSVNPTHILDEFVVQLADRWGFDPARPIAKTSTNRIPMGGSVDPKAGPTFLAVGDAAASANPFDGEGIGMAYETGRLAADVLHDAIDSGDAAALQRYPQLLEDRYGEYQRTARLFARIVGRPALVRQLGRTAVRSRTIMSSLLRIDLGLLRADERGVAEVGYRALATVAKLAPGT